MAEGGGNRLHDPLETEEAGFGFVTGGIGAFVVDVGSCRSTESRSAAAPDTARRAHGRRRKCRVPARHRWAHRLVAGYPHSWHSRSADWREFRFLLGGSRGEGRVCVERANAQPGRPANVAPSRMKKTVRKESFFS
jgi:hypothetical protein